MKHLHRDSIYKQLLVRNIVHVELLKINWCLGNIITSRFPSINNILSAEGCLQLSVPGPAALPEEQDGGEGEEHAL